MRLHEVAALSGTMLFIGLSAVRPRSDTHTSCVFPRWQLTFQSERACQPVSQPASQPVSQSVSQSADKLFGPAISGALCLTNLLLWQIRDR